MLKYSYICIKSWTVDIFHHLTALIVILPTPTWYIFLNESVFYHATTNLLPPKWIILILEYCFVCLMAFFFFIVPQKNWQNNNFSMKMFHALQRKSDHFTPIFNHHTGRNPSIEETRYQGTSFSSHRSRLEYLPATRLFPSGSWLSLSLDSTFSLTYALSTCA